MPSSRFTRSLARHELLGVRLFEDVAIEAVWHLLEKCPLHVLADGQVLMRPGDKSRSLYIILQGELRVHLDTPSEDPVATLPAGETVGELALIDERPRSAYVVAGSQARVLEVYASLAWSLLHSSHEMSLNLLGIVSQRLRGNNAAVSESRKLQQQYKRHASTDALTGLYNRRWLDDLLPRQARRSLMQNEPLSVLMIDVDHFKRFNDTHGHAAGDFVLFAVAQVLRQRLRPTDLVARYGGEEFTVVLPATDLTGAQVAGERARAAIEETELVLPDHTRLPNVTASIGAAQLQADQGASALIEVADGKLYEAKHAGRNRVCA